MTTKEQDKHFLQWFKHMVSVFFHYALISSNIVTYVIVGVIFFDFELLIQLKVEWSTDPPRAPLSPHLPQVISDNSTGWHLVGKPTLLPITTKRRVDQCVLAQVQPKENLVTRGSRKGLSGEQNSHW